ncbi:hypothetical protein [Streptococcus suis]|uniref:hypothetical protein n=1 Tax=Streptococcus suis TaxID=1307 RepID=UPI000CF4772E|nr:hypothetical protein [Streptococcus suis]
MKKRIKKKRWLEIKLAECLAREHVLMSAVTEQNARITKQANEITELRSIVERNAQATNSRFDKLEEQVVKSNAKKPFWKR